MEYPNTNKVIFRNEAEIRIAILSTPKTGNLWLRTLLSDIYDLPTLDVSHDFTGYPPERTPDRFIFYHHFLPTAPLLRWLSENRVAVLTTIRHPGDVLVSLFHFVKALVEAGAAYNESHRMARDGTVPGRHTADIVSTEFFRTLDISIQWMSYCVDVVRYEELNRDCVSTLRRVTDRLHGVNDERLHDAAVRNTFDLMRDSGKYGVRHFRRGESGDWRNELPMEIREYLRTREPYKTQCEVLGYQFDYDESLNGAEDPFAGRSAFDNGVPIPDIARDLYRGDSHYAVRWPKPCEASGEDTYFNWLNRPATSLANKESVTVITNLLLEIYKRRADLHPVFPDILNESRDGLCDWFVVHGRAEFNLDIAFVSPVLVSRALRARAALARLNRDNQ